MKFVKETSQTMLTFTTAQIEALVTLSQNIVIELSKRIENSDYAKKITSHKNYDDTKNLGMASIHALSAIYNGLFEAIGLIVNEHKYGKEVAGIMQNGLETVDNIKGMTMVFKGVVVQKIEEGTCAKKKEDDKK